MFVLSAFMTKLLMNKRNFGRGEFSQFSNLSETEKNGYILSYCEYLDSLHLDFNKRIDYILKLNLSNWILDPLSDP